MLNLEPSELPVIQIGVAQPCVGMLWCAESITGGVAVSSWLSSFALLCPFVSWRVCTWKQSQEEERWRSEWGWPSAQPAQPILSSYKDALLVRLLVDARTRRWTGRRGRKQS